MRLLASLRHLTSFLLLAQMLVPPPAYGQTPRILTGQVVKVVDGDTIHVRVGDRMERVRYIGVNAPELGQPGGRERPPRPTASWWRASL